MGNISVRCLNIRQSIDGVNAVESLTRRSQRIKNGNDFSKMIQKIRY